MVDRPQHLALGQLTCGCGDAVRCCGHPIPMLSKLPSRPNLLPAGLQPSPGAVAEAEARGLLLTESQQAALRRVERRRSKFRRQLRRGPDVLRAPRVVRGLALLPTEGASATVKGLGLNATQLFACADDDFTKYGAPDGQGSDVMAAGASVVRQLGTRDLVWQFLVDRDMAEAHGLVDGGAVKVPFEADSTGTWYEAGTVLDDLILSAANVERFAELLSMLADRGLKAIFTFLTLGGGGGTADGSATTTVGGVSYEIREAARLLWAEGHTGRVLEDGSPYPYRDGGGDFDDSSLDPGSAYKRAVMAAIAQRSIDLLVQAMDLAFGENRSLVLGDVVAGIEIFNEIGIRSWFSVDDTDPTLRYVAAKPAGTEWGTAWFDVARAMWDAFDMLDADRDRVDFFLPGIESWVIWNSDYFPGTWQYKKDHLTAMLDEIQSQCEGWTDGPDNPFTSLVGGVDLHWYHKQIPGLETNYADPVSTDLVPQQGYCHVGFLVLELGELRALLDGEPYGLTEASISVMETGMSTSLVHLHYPDADTSDPMDVMKALDFVPSAFQDQETAWQGLEVWRRLGAALAGPADAAGWHSWMSGESDTFQGMGLRVDTQKVDEDDDGEEIWAPTPNDADSTLALTRQSWWCYRRLAEELGGVVTSGRMVLPAVATRGDLYDLVYDNPSWTSGDSVVVFEYRLASGDYAYLAFVEPCFLVGPGGDTDFYASGTVGDWVDARVETAFGSRTLRRTIDTLPGDRRSLVVPMWAGAGDCGPLLMKAFRPGFVDDSVHYMSPRSVLRLVWETDSISTLSPVLFVSSARLSWSS